MLGASRKKDITALALVSSIGSTGAELNMWQVTHGLDRSKRPAEERNATIELQKRIQTAALTGRGWDAIAPQFRQQADTPWFRSFLGFDPARVLSKISQPLLIVHGALDTHVPPDHADRLEALAKQRKNRAVDVVRIPGLNHLLVPAVTGEADEYAMLKDRQVSPLAANAIVEWLRRSFAAR